MAETNETPNNATPVPPTAQGPLPPGRQELNELRDFLQSNGLSIAFGVLSVVVVIVLVSMFRARKEEGAQQAAQILAAAQTPQDLQTIIDKHGDTPYAPIALLKLAKTSFNAGDYDGAMAKYADFKQKYPTHPLVDGASLDRLFCLEAKGQTEEAMNGFAAFAKEHPKHYLSAQAAFGHGRCLEQLGKLDEARIVYEDFISGNPDSQWLTKAEERLATVKRKLKIDLFESGNGKAEIQKAKTKDSASTVNPAP